MELKNILNAYFNNEYSSDLEKVWVIFGAGQRGQRLFYKLEKNNLKVSCFCDNDIIKQSEIICGIPVVGLEKLMEDKRKYYMLVSPKYGWDIVNKLEKEGFPYIMPPNITGTIFNWEGLNSYIEKENFSPLGHFYSLYPDLEEIKNKEEQLFLREKDVRDIDFNEENQIKTLHKMQLLYDTIPNWTDITEYTDSNKLRYKYNNNNLSHADAIGLHCMLRILRPKRVIEVGSGYTSAVMLDTNEFYLNNQIKLKFIEPYPDLLKSLVKPQDELELLPEKLQDVSFNAFEKLEEGDVLFIDSTHVSKIGSDVNYLFFDIFPRLAKGVYIHLHDIFYPFEYPKEWIYSGRVWNELYLLRAFLQNNDNYKTIYFQNMMEKKYRDIFMENWPIHAPIQGGSFWMQKK